MRGFAALFVAYFHCRQIVWVGMRDFHHAYVNALSPGTLAGYLTLPFAWGPAGVSIFFVISGYCIHRNGAYKLAADPANVTGISAARGVASGTPFADLFSTAGQKYGVDPALLAAIAKQESGYNPRAVSPAGAQGLMQLMPGTAAGLGVENPFDPAQAVDGAARLMRDLLDRFGRTDLALAAYNAGPGAVLKYGGIPPYPETQRYVPAVLSIQRTLEAAA